MLIKKCIPLYVQLFWVENGQKVYVKVGKAMGTPSYERNCNKLSKTTPPTIMCHPQTRHKPLCFVLSFSLFISSTIYKVMGAGRSKLVTTTETARSVIARRDEKNVVAMGQEAATNIINKVTDNELHNEAPVNTQKIYGTLENMDMDPDMVRQIEKWSVVREKNKRSAKVSMRTTFSICIGMTMIILLICPQAPIKKMHGKPSAALLRIREEKERENLSKEQMVEKNYGRLDEEQAMNMLKKIRYEQILTYKRAYFICSFIRQTANVNPADIAKEFHLTTEIIENVMRHVQWPIVDEKLKNEDNYPIAR